MSAQHLHTNRTGWILILALAFPSIMLAQFGGQPGAFSRMGFGARGTGMSNAMTAVSQGEVFGYYNPAEVARSSGHTGAASFGLLSLAGC
jgi:hypothetical protein